jgi:hypothetical protein
MMPPDEWETVLGRLVGTVYRGTERISSAVIMNALDVPTDRWTRAKEGKRIVHLNEKIGVDRTQDYADRRLYYGDWLLALAQCAAENRA